MKKSMKNVLIITSVIICLVSFFLILSYLWIEGYCGDGTPPRCNLNVTENETCWRIIVTNVSLGDADSLPKKRVSYILSRTVEGNYTSLESGNLHEIDGIPSYKYNITWLDKDKDTLLSKGDEFIISKSGGSEGKAERGDRFVLVYGGMALCEEQVL